MSTTAVETVPQNNARDNVSPLCRLAANIGADAEGLRKTIVKMVFGGVEPSKEEFLAILMVAEQLGLNPLMGEMWGFKARNGVVQPIVSVDGWKNIMLRQPNFDGYEIVYSDNLIRINQTELPEWAECTIYLKNRSHPVKERVYASEKFVMSSPVWKSSPRLMLRHRAMIQAIRFAFPTTGGIHDENDEQLIEQQEREGVLNMAHGAVRPVNTQNEVTERPPVLQAPKPAMDMDKFNTFVGSIISRAQAARSDKPDVWEEARAFVRKKGFDPMLENLALTRIAEAESEADANPPADIEALA